MVFADGFVVVDVVVVVVDSGVEPVDGATAAAAVDAVSQGFGLACDMVPCVVLCTCVIWLQLQLAALPPSSQGGPPSEFSSAADDSQPPPIFIARSAWLRSSGLAVSPSCFGQR